MKKPRSLILKPHKDTFKQYKYKIGHLAFGQIFVSAQKVIFENEAEDVRENVALCLFLSKYFICVILNNKTTNQEINRER